MAVGQRDFLPFDENRAACVGRIDTGEYLHQRAFAGAVLAGKREHFARADLEIHAIERLDAGEGSGDVAHLQKRNACHGAHHFV